MVLDLRIVFFTLAHLCRLLIDFESQLISLKPVLGYHLIHTTPFDLAHIIGIRLFFSYLLDTPFSLIDPELRLGKCSQNIRRHSVNMQLSFTLETDSSEVLLIVFWVELWEREILIDTIGAAKGCTEIALRIFLALPLGFRLPAYPTLFLSDLR